MKSSPNPTFTGCMGLLALACLFGCGTGAYEDRLERSIGATQSRSKFNVLAAAATVPNTSITIRVPHNKRNKNFSEFTLLTAGAAGKKRLKPPVDFPDWEATYEALITDSNGGQIPCYLYVDVDDISQGRHTVTDYMLLNSMSDKLSSTSEVQSYQGETPEGRSVEWKKIHGEGKMPFVYIDPQGKESDRQLQGVFELLFRRSGKKMIYLGWRAPKRYVDFAKVDQWLSLVAGCISVPEDDSSE